MAKDRARDAARRPVIKVQPAYKSTGAAPKSHVEVLSESKEDWGARKYGAELAEHTYHSEE